MRADLVVCHHVVMISSWTYERCWDSHPSQTEDDSHPACIAGPFYVGPLHGSCTGCPVWVNPDGWNVTWAPNAFVLGGGPIKLLQATSQHSSTAGSRPVRSGGALKQPTSIIQLLGEARDVGVTLLRWGRKPRQ